MIRKPKYPKEKLKELLSPLASLLSDEDWNRVYDECYILEYGKGELIHRKGEVSRNLMCVIEGNVKLFSEIPGDKIFIIKLLKPFHFYGFQSNLLNRNYMTHAATFTGATLCAIPMDLIVEIMEGNFDLSMMLLKRVAADLGYSDQRIVMLMQKQMRGRLADTLLTLADYYGYEPDGKTLAIYLQRSDLADLSYMTEANAIRTLSAFASENLVKVNKRRITLLDVEKLTHVSLYE